MRESTEVSKLGGAFNSTNTTFVIGDDGSDRQLRAILAFDTHGIPDGATMQMEGCIMMGLGYALAEEVRFNGGEVLDKNFDTYKIPRFSWMPEIETIIVDAKDSPPQGGGEPAVICMGGLIANAIFDATGRRLRELPLAPDGVVPV